MSAGVAPSARERILERVRAAWDGRARAERPGAFGGWRSGDGDGARTPVDAFVARFERAGGEVVRADADAEAAAWLRRFLEGSMPASTTPAGGADRGDETSPRSDRGPTAPTSVGAGVPRNICATRGAAPPETAAVGVSMARGAVAETGSLILDARDGRRTQLLPPVHVVLVRERDVHATLAGALVALGSDLPSAIGLHSGPSKSADIGQILVKGVHGPGRVIALLIQESP